MKILALTTGIDNCNVWWNSLKSIGHKVFIERYDNRPHHLHSDLIALAKVYKPDYVVFAGANEEYHKKPVPSLSILCRLNDVAPTILICGDGRDERWWDILDLYDKEQCFTLQVNVDGSFETPIADYKNGLVILCPIDASVYNPKPWCERIIDCGMFARYYQRPDRQVLVEEAVKCGLKFQSSDVLRSYSTMASIMCGTKITFNDATAVDGEPWLHVKARVVEAGFAGCCLFETFDSPTRYWFSPGIDYIEYESPKDLQFALKNVDVFSEFADRFHSKVVKEHHPSVVWQKVFDAVNKQRYSAANVAA